MLILYFKQINKGIRFQRSTKLKSQVLFRLYNTRVVCCVVLSLLWKLLSLAKCICIVCTYLLLNWL